MQTKFKKILLIRPEMIGDTILLSPIVSAIKNKYPESKIFLLLQHPMEEVIKDNPDISGYIFTKKALNAREYLSLLKKIRNERFDLSIVFEDNPTPSYAFMCLLAGIPNRIGDKSRLLYGWTYNKGAWVKSADNTLHHVELYFKLIEKLGIKNLAFPLKIAISPNTRNILRDHMGPADDKKIIGLHIGTGGGNKALLPETYAQISDLLQDKISCRIILIGGKNEVFTLEKIKSVAAKPFLDFVGKLSIQELFLAIKQLDLFIGVDSGPMHAAAAFSIPTVAIYTAKDVNPCRWFPWMTRNIIIKSAKDRCNIKCSHRECELNDCLVSIDPKEIVESANILLSGGGNKTVEETRKSALI